MREKQPVYFCKISAPSEKIVTKSEFFALKKYVETKFSLTAIKFEKINSQGCIVIAFATMKDLRDKKIYHDIVEKKLRQISSYQGDSLSVYCPNPIIFIGMEDIMQVKSPGNIKDNSHKIFEKLNLDPRFRFWDSSIWHRYVPLNKDFATSFGEALEEIKGYFEQRLYTTNVSMEFLEFQTRMLVNSYLAPIGEGGHATDVTPYKFHSETAMKAMADRELKEINSMDENLQWRFLLIDDYGNAPLLPEPVSGKTGITKKKVINSLLEKQESSIKTLEISAPLETADSTRADDVIDWALGELKKGRNMYDIILLDYLLGENTKDKTKAREFGSDFLKILNKTFDENKKSNPDDNKIKNNKGPLGHFWIFPISVFSYAMLDEIHQQGLGHISNHWYLSAGADPVNTPQLFRYNLYRFMNLQIKTAPINLDGFMEGSFKSKVEMIGTSARDCHPEFTTLRSRYNILNKDKTHNSLFANSILKKIEEGKPPGLWDHLTHLIYLLAYGAGVEWPEMWEEYNYVKQHFTKDDTEFMNKIRKYIIHIKPD